MQLVFSRTIKIVCLLHTSYILVNSVISLPLADSQLLSFFNCGHTVACKCSTSTDRFFFFFFLMTWVQQLVWRTTAFPQAIALCMQICRSHNGKKNINPPLHTTCFLLCSEGSCLCPACAAEICRCPSMLRSVHSLQTSCPTLSHQLVPLT